MTRDLSLLGHAADPIETANKSATELPEKALVADSTRGEQMKLVALDLEGSGAQDREQEAILEIAVVPLRDRQPDLDAVYSTLINPGRSIPQRRWISPGLTDDVLSTAPPPSAVEPQLAARLDGTYLVGHNIGVDWRLLHRRCPHLAPVGLIDTLLLARAVDRKANNNLAVLVERFALSGEVNRLAAGSVPHRALWDTVAAALLMPILASSAIGADPSDDDLFAVAGASFVARESAPQTQSTLF